MKLLSEYRWGRISEFYESTKIKTGLKEPFSVSGYLIKLEVIASGSKMSQIKWKREAAMEAAKLVKEGMLVGLGSGSTVAEMIKILGEKKSGAKFVASSASTQQLADKLGLDLVSLDENPELDLAIDGADEVDPNFSMIKGGGGAHTREKIIANASEEVAIVVDRTKLALELGKKRPVPIEVIPFAHEWVANQLRDKLGGDPQLRKSREGGPYVTDNGNYILDTKFESIENPSKLESKLNKIPGVVENGIFVNLADRILVGYEDGCTVLASEKDFLEFLAGKQERSV